MSATIHKLYPEGAPAAAALPAAPHPAVVALQEQTCRLLTERLSRMFDGADDLLFEMSERAANNEEQRLYFDTMRVIRLERSQLSDSFAREIEFCFDRDYRPETRRQALDEIDFDHLALQDTETLEQSIAVANMEAKAEGLYRNLLWELERRLSNLARDPSAGISPRALAPAGLCHAIRNGIDALKIGFDIKLVIYKLFDRLVMGDLAPVYIEALRLLGEHDIQAAAPAVGSGTAPRMPSAEAQMSIPGFETVPGIDAGAAAGAFGALPAGGGYAAGPAMSAYGAPQIDPQTLGALQYLGGGGTPGPIRYSDAMLATELAAAARGQSVQGLDAGRAWASVQRAGLVGRMFNDILADPHLPQGIKPIFEGLRFPTIKTALTDLSFFSNAGHPVRALINELATMAAAARASEPEAVDRMQELVDKVRGQFDLAADQVRPAVDRAQPVQESDIERFLEQQLAQGQKRRQAILDKARRVVAQELQLQTLGHDIADSVQPLLNSGWAPMAGLTLLRHGADSEAWQRALELLREIVQSLDRRQPERRNEAARGQLLDSITTAFGEVGTQPQRTQDLLGGLSTAWEALAAVPGRVIETGAAAPENRVAEPITESAAPAEMVETPAQDAGGELVTRMPELEEMVATPPAVEATAPLSPADQVLELLLTAGAWFRVYDREHGDTRWLKVVLYSQELHTVSFAEFDGNNTLTLPAADLLEDLKRRRTEPIDPPPAGKHALRQLIAEQTPQQDAATA